MKEIDVWDLQTRNFHWSLAVFPGLIRYGRPTLPTCASPQGALTPRGSG